MGYIKSAGKHNVLLSFEVNNINAPVTRKLDVDADIFSISDCAEEAGTLVIALDRINVDPGWEKS